MLTRLRLAYLALFFVSLLLGCTGNTHQQSLPALQPDLAGGAWAGIPFPSSNETGMPVHWLSDATVEQYGEHFAAQAGGANREAPEDPRAYIIQPAGTERMAWARYALTLPENEGPVELALTLSPVLPDPPGDPFPYEFYVGLAEYSRFAWEWHGPFTATVPITMNSADVRGRYANAGGIVHVVVLVFAPEETAKDAAPLPAVQIDTVSVDTLALDGGNYFTPLPYRVDFNMVSESYKPVPDVLMTWNTVLVPGETLTYHLYRQGPDDTEPVELGTMTETDTEFLDPQNNSGGLPGPVRGLVYNYFIRAESPLGWTQFSPAYPVNIPPAGTWARTYGTADVDEGIDGGTDGQSNVYLVGNCSPYSYAQEYIQILGLDPDGDLRWSKKYDLANVEDKVYDAVYADNGTFYFCGMSNLMSMPDEADKVSCEGLLAGITSAGDLALATTIGSGTRNGSEAYWHMAYVGGDLVAGGVADSYAIMGRRKNSGDHTVLKCQDTNGYFGTGQMVVDAEDNYYMTASTNLPVVGGLYLAKYSSSGLLQWSKSCDGMFYDTDSRLEATQIALGPDGSIYTAGDGQGPFSSADAWVIKYSSTGEFLWMRCVGGPYKDRARGLVVDDLGFVYLVSYNVQLPGYYTYIISVLRFDSEGNLTRAKGWASPVDNRIEPAQAWMDQNGYLYIVGTTPNALNIRSFPLQINMDQSLSCVTQAFTVTPENYAMEDIDHGVGTLSDLVITADTGGGAEDLFIMKLKWPW